MDRLKDKVAIITGGAGGLGSVSAARFIQEGAKVVVADLYEDRAKEVAERLGPNAAGMFYDANDEASIGAAVAKTVERFGRLDILFNNAAATEQAVQMNDTTGLDISLDVWDRIMSVNLRGVLIGCRFAIPHMAAVGGGSIINMASNSALGGEFMRIGYGTSKGAMIVMNKYLAVQYGAQNIRCNVIAPGLILTPHLAGSLFEVAMQRHVALPRHGRPDDIANLATFLASDESGFISGQTISCDGGNAAHLPQAADMRDVFAQVMGQAPA
jgi:NAD(P)-dependent dehydrogenase (short-subunit alcohol dehydrogenase family)